MKLNNRIVVSQSNTAQYALYETLAARDWYRDVTRILTADSEPSMHRDLVLYFIKTQALLITPVAPHVADHIWTEVLSEKKSIQFARFPETSKPVDLSVLKAATYVRSTIKSIRDAELAIIKRSSKKGKGAVSTFDSTQPKSLTLYIAKEFPDWQAECIPLIQAAYDASSKTIDRSKLRQAVDEAGLSKDKRIMPFCVAFQVNKLLGP